MKLQLTIKEAEFQLEQLLIELGYAFKADVEIVNEALVPMSKAFPEAQDLRIGNNIEALRANKIFLIKFARDVMTMFADNKLNNTLTDTKQFVEKHFNL